jgi:hypothetical protein
VEITHTRSSTRDRISRKRSRHVVETTGVIFRENEPKGSALIRNRYLELLKGGI